MKSFRLYLVAPPIREVADYRPEELERFRAEFRPVVQRYRRQQAAVGILLAVVFAGLVLVWVFPSFFPWYASIFFVCWLTMMAFATVFANMECPACNNVIDHGFGMYCPECGAHSLLRTSLIRAPCCLSCRKEMHGGKRRNYRNRYCTHCGVPLDENGI